MKNKLPFMDRLIVPVIAAPMLRVSGIELVSAACASGVIGAFPTANCQSLDEFDSWLQRLNAEAKEFPQRAPHCPNLIMRRDPAKLKAEIELIVKHQTELVITSVGSPEAVIPTLHEGGCLVFADVASVHHAERAIQAGVDGLILLCAGAGGHTGWANPFAFVRAVRRLFDGPMVLSGGLSDGIALRAATVLGCDLGCIGTRFIATHESLAAPAYKKMLLQSSIDDIVATRAFTGLPANFLKPSIRGVGLDPDDLDESITVQEARRKFGGGADGAVIQRWADLWSAGHSVSGVTSISHTTDVVRAMLEEYESAM